MDNEYKILIRLSSDDYDFCNDIENYKNYEIKTIKKGENLRLNSSFIARANILIIEHIYEKQISEININDNYDKLINLFKLIENKYINNKIKKEFYLSCSINNDQFGFEINEKLISLLSNYGFSLSVSGIAYLWWMW